MIWMTLIIFMQKKVQCLDYHIKVFYQRSLDETQLSFDLLIQKYFG